MVLKKRSVKDSKVHKRKNDKKEKLKKKFISDEEISDSEVQVNLEFFNMSEVDFHSVKQFLTVSFGATDHKINISEMAAFITEECADHIGSTVKTEGEQSDPLAVVTCVPLEFSKEKSFSNALTEFLLAKASLNIPKESVALVINERFINMPAGIAGPMLENLVMDWKNAIKEEPKFRVNHILYLTPIYKFVASKLDEEMGLVGSEMPSDSIEFYYQESELFSKYADQSFDFKIATTHETADSRRAFTEHGVEAARRIYLIRWDHFLECIKEINQTFVE